MSAARNLAGRDGEPQSGAAKRAGEYAQGVVAFTMRWSGGYRLAESSAQRPLAFAIRCCARGRRIEAEGELDAEGLATHAAARGVIALGTMSCYRLEFADDAGVPHLLVGRQRLSLRGRPTELTVMRAELWRDDQVIGEALLRFDLRSELPGLVHSFRWTRPPA